MCAPELWYLRGKKKCECMLCAVCACDTMLCTLIMTHITLLLHAVKLISTVSLMVQGQTEPLYIL